jgi:hypothetical protein
MSMSPEAKAAALLGLIQHPGFAVLCERHKEDAEALRDSAMDEEDDVKAAKLRVAYKFAVELDPAKQAERLLKIARRQTEKANSSTDGVRKIMGT